MAVLRYVVGSDGAGGWQIWQINSADKVLGRYTTRAEAVRAAVNTAQAVGETNPDGAQVLVQSRVCQFRVEWTYGDDPYPPPAARQRPSPTLHSGLDPQRIRVRIKPV